MNATRGWLLAVVCGVAALVAAGCADEDLTAGPAGASSPGGTSAGMGPGISVAEARASRLDGPLLVNGFVVAQGGRVRLCDALAESFPPQCGGPSLDVSGLDVGALEGVQAAGDARWTDGRVQVLGAVEDGALTVSGTAK